MTKITVVQSMRDEIGFCIEDKGEKHVFERDTQERLL
jgi:hypothetical protein